MEILFNNRKKDNTQIKSFDQRMKRCFKDGKNIDLTEAICVALKKLPLNEEES